MQTQIFFADFFLPIGTSAATDSEPACSEQRQQISFIRRRRWIFVSELHRSTRNNGRGLAMAVALASLASSALASLAAALIAIWLCSRFVLPRIISLAVRRLRDHPRAFVSPEKTRVAASS